MQCVKVFKTHLNSLQNVFKRTGCLHVFLYYCSSWYIIPYCYPALSPTRAAAWIKSCEVGVEFHRDQHERGLQFPYVRLLATTPTNENRLLLRQRWGRPALPPLGERSAGVPGTSSRSMLNAQKLPLRKNKL